MTDSYDDIGRHDYEAKNVPLADAKVDLDFRHLKRGSILVIEVIEGCIAVESVEKKFKLGDVEMIGPHIFDGLARTATEPWGLVSIIVRDHAPRCVATFALKSGDLALP